MWRSTAASSSGTWGSAGVRTKRGNLVLNLNILPLHQTNSCQISVNLGRVFPPLCSVSIIPATLSLPDSVLTAVVSQQAPRLLPKPILSQQQPTSLPNCLLTPQSLPPPHRYFSSRTLQAVSQVGTPYYMSPECIKGQPYDFSSDVWSLGCLLYELVALRNPFFKEHLSLYVLGKNISSCTYEPLPESTQPALRALVSAMLQPSPQARPTVGQLVEVVRQARGG